MKRIVEFSPAFDKRDPDLEKNYGIHCVTLRMTLKGQRGAVQFVLFTGWQLPHIRDEFKGRADRALPADIGYHSPVPMYEGQTKLTEACEYLDGRPCYYDGSGLAADRFFDVMTQEGDAGVWRELERYYIETFEELV